MANVAAIRTVGTSLAAYLNRAYQVAPFPANVSRPSCTFTLLTIGALRAADIVVANDSAQVLILLYRASMNQHLRNSGRPARPDMALPPLSVDLHYLLSFWAASSEVEQLVLAWTLRQLHQTPALDASILSPEAQWTPDEVIQLIPEEISNEDMFRIWDALEPEHYRLSLAYIARVVRIDPDEIQDLRRVVATRFDYAVPVRQP